MDARQYPTSDATYGAYAKHISPGKVALFRQLDLHLVMGEREGSIFTDAYTGDRLYNCHCNGGVFNLGHRNAKVLDAVREAFDSVDIGNHHLVSGLRASLAERLSATTGGELPGVIFGVGGGEAMDLALKAARGVTGRQGVVSAKGGYHGHTGLAVAAGDPEYRTPFGPNLPGFVQVPFDDLDALEAAVGDTTAAVLLEPVPATLGMPIASGGYFRSVGDIVRRAGHHGRGTDRSWKDRIDVVLPAARRRPRHPRHRQGFERRRLPDQRDDDDTGGAVLFRAVAARASVDVRRS